MTPKLNIPGKRNLPQGRVAQRKVHLMREIDRPQRPRRNFSFGSRRTWVLIPALGLMMGAAAVASQSVFDDDSGPPASAGFIGEAYCAEQASADSQRVWAFNKAFQDAEPGERDRLIRDPVGACAKLWKEGVLSPEPSSPDLVGCRDGKLVTVVPGKTEAACLEARMRPLGANYGGRVKNFQQTIDDTQKSIEESWRGRFDPEALWSDPDDPVDPGSPASKCAADSGKIAAELRGLLRARRLTGWSVRLGRVVESADLNSPDRVRYGGSARRCATGLAVDAGRRRIAIDQDRGGFGLGEGDKPSAGLTYIPATLLGGGCSQNVRGEQAADNFAECELARRFVLHENVLDGVYLRGNLGTPNRCRSAGEVAQQLNSTLERETGWRVKPSDGTATPLYDKCNKDLKTGFGETAQLVTAYDVTTPQEDYRVLGLEVVLYVVPKHDLHGRSLRTGREPLCYSDMPDWNPCSERSLRGELKSMY